MIIKSLDPRINRARVDDEAPYEPKQSFDQWENYEVFHQKKRGTQHVHVGSVHAPNAELAFLFAKEQYTRRGQCVNIWVVRTADVFASEYEDDDIFETTPEKKHREAESYKVMDRIKAYKERNQQNA